MLKAIMISGRTLAQGVTCEDKMSSDFLAANSVCSLSQDDCQRLGLLEGENVLLKNDFGQAVLSARADPGLPAGVVFIPMGPWANVLVGPETEGCGTPHFKGVEVEVGATDAPVLSVRDLFRDMIKGVEA
jgi:formylmethanofuran dehydrogenase subunit D